MLLYIKSYLLHYTFMIYFHNKTSEHPVLYKEIKSSLILLKFIAYTGRFLIKQSVHSFVENFALHLRTVAFITYGKTSRTSFSSKYNIKTTQNY